MKYLILLLIIGCAPKPQERWSSLDCGGEPFVDQWLADNDDEMSFEITEACTITIESCNAVGHITERIEETSSAPAYAVANFEVSDATPGCPAVGDVKCSYMFEPSGKMDFNCGGAKPPYHVYERAP